jgi:hypothetical protein
MFLERNLTPAFLQSLYFNTQDQIEAITYFLPTFFSNADTNP